MTRRRWLLAATSGAAAFALAVLSLALFAVTRDSPVDVSDRSIAALLAWSTFALWLSTLALVGAATVAGFFAFLDFRESRRQSANSDLTLRAQHLPVVSLNHPSVEDTHAYINVKNIGPGPAISPHIEAWLSFVEQEGRTHGDVLADAQAHRERSLSESPQLEGSCDSLGGGETIERFELRANEKLELTGPKDALVVAHWRVGFADIFGEMHTRTGTSMVAVDLQDA